MIEYRGGKLEATATELYQAPQEAGCEVLPAAPRELSKSVKALAARFPALRVASGYCGKQKVLRLELLKNIVGMVGIYGKGAIKAPVKSRGDTVGLFVERVRTGRKPGQRSDLGRP